MKCTKCKTENLVKANYCKACGNRFTPEEKEKARKTSTVEILKKAEDIKEKTDKVKDILSLSFITDNVYVRLVLIIIPFAIGMLFGGGDNNMKIRKSDYYRVYHNTTTDEYYLQVEQSNINLMLYVPEDTKEIKVSFTEDGGCSWDEDIYQTDRPIIIESRDYGYYTIEAVTESENQSIVLYTVEGGAN